MRAALDNLTGAQPLPTRALPRSTTTGRPVMVTPGSLWSDDEDEKQPPVNKKSKRKDSSASDSDSSQGSSRGSSPRRPRPLPPATTTTSTCLAGVPTRAGAALVLLAVLVALGVWWIRRQQAPQPDAGAQLPPGAGADAVLAAAPELPAITTSP